MLHLIFQSPVETAVLERIGPGDIAVFLENSVFCILQNYCSTIILVQLLNKNRLYVLSEDLEVRGIAAETLIKGIEVIDYAEIVKLTVNNQVIQSWLQ
jgi:tRNA 2-thiouridine synthesizing protein B